MEVEVEPRAAIDDVIIIDDQEPWQPANYTFTNHTYFEMANFTYEFVTEAIIEMNNFDNQTYTVGCIDNSEAFKVVL